VVVNQIASYSPHPLMPAHERVIITDTPLAGETIVEWMQRTGLAERIGRQPIRVTINGWRVGREVWKTCRPKPGTTIHIQAEVRGGGGSGGKVLRTVAFIILAYLSYGTSTAMTSAGYSAAAATAASAAVMVAGSLAINALFPLPKPQLPSGKSDESPNYSLSGGSNRPRPYEPMPSIMGTHRVYPDFGARPYTEFRDGQQYLFQVFDFGYNSDVALSDFKIGENAIDNFTGVTLEESGPDGKLSIFPANVDTIAGGNLVAGSPGPYVTRTSSPDSTALAVEIDGVLFRTTDAGDLEALSVGVDIQYRPVGGTTWTQVQLVDDSNPLLAPQGTYSFFGIPIPFGSAGVSKLRYDEAVANGVPGQITIVNSNRTPLRRTFRWEVAKGQYEVKVARSTPFDQPVVENGEVVEGEKHLVREIVFTQLRCYQPDTADYIGRKRIAIAIRASGQLNGTVEQFNCMARAKTIVWTGTGWAKQQTSNPAWWALAAARGTYVKPIQRYFDTDLGTKATAPHNPACVITSDLEVIVQWNSTLWHANGFDTVFDKTGTVGQSQFYVAVRSAGGLQIAWSADGSAPSALLANSTVVVPFADDGTMKWLRYRLDVNNGAGGWTVTFDWSEDKIAWTQLGAPVTGVGVTSVFPGTSPVVIGSSNGKLGYAEVRNGFGGPIVTKFDPSVEALTGATTFVSAAGDTWTMTDRVPPLGGKPYIQEIAGSRRASGAGLPDSRIDIENLKSFGAWCAAQNLTFNYVFDQPITAGDMIDTIALRGRGTKSWGSGKLGVVWDAPAQPVVGVFSMANTVAGSFEIEYMTEQLADEVVISFDNPDLGYARDTVRIPPGLASPALSRTVDTVGCTSKTEAAQDGNLYLANNAYRARRYRWQMDFEGMPLSRGEVGTLAQDLAALDYTGRLAEGSTASVLQLCRAVVLPISGAFVTIFRPDGTAVTAQVLPGTGVETTQLSLVSALSFNPGADANHPPYDYKFVFGTSSLPGRKVKVESIRPVSESIVELTAVDETPDYYAAKDLPFTYTGPRLGAAPVISDLQITEEGVRVAGGYMVKGTVTFNITGDYESCDIRVSINGSQWTSLANNSRVSSAEFIAADFSDVVVEVTAHGKPGARTAEGKATLTKTLDFAGESPPANVTQFTIDGRTFRWRPVDDVDVKGYIIRFQYGQNLSFPDATRLHDGVLPYSPKTFDTLPTGFCTFFITAVDAADLESVTPAIVVTDLGDPETQNVVVRTDLRTASWPGSVTGGSNVAGDLLATGTTEFYGADAAPFYGADAADFYETEVYMQMVYTSNRLFFPLDWISYPLLVDFAIDGQSIAIEYRTSSENLIANPGAETGTTASWSVVEGSGAVTASTFDKTQGTYSFKLATPGAKAGGAKAIALVPGAQYAVRVKVRGSSAAASGLYIRMNESTTYPAGDYVTSALRTSTTDFAANVAVTLGWTSYDFTYTVPVGVNWGTISVYNNSSGVDVYYDEVTVRKLAVASDWRPWIGALTVQDRDYELRVTTSNSAIQGAIHQLAAVVDVPDVWENLLSVSIGVGGTRLPITQAYHAITNVQLTLQQVGTAVGVRIIDRNPTLGPLIETIDSTRTSVTGTIDAHIRGY
jgi:hypothetical protein